MVNTNCSMKERYVIYSLVRKSDIAFYGFFNNSSIVNQRLEMMNVMQFDMLIV